MIEFSIENLVDVNVALDPTNGQVTYIVNGALVNVQDFQAIMSAIQVLFAVHAEPDDDEEEDDAQFDPNSAVPPPFGG